MKKWQLQEAKAKLSTLIKETKKGGPQQITVRGKAEAVILSAKQYEKLSSPENSFVEFMANSPLKGLDIKVQRDKSLCRDLEL